jgi:hypothetical protein
MRDIHVVSSCTLQKRFDASENCSLRSCSGKSWEQSLKTWSKHVQDPRLAQHVADHLYQGSHWKETHTCLQEAEKAGYSPQFWVLSAGWGFIKATEEIPAYTATFSSQGEDSIHNLSWPQDWDHKERGQHWWDGLNKSFRNKSMADCLVKATTKKKRPLIFFILSKDYYQAVEHELLELEGFGYEIAIVSASLFINESGATHPALRQCILPFSDKFKQADPYLNKDNVSLNARLAAWVFREYASQIEEGLDSLYESLLRFEATLPEMERNEVVKMTDDEVLAFIDRLYEPQGNSTATRLLRILRDQERKSCEQKRFKALFKSYVASSGHKGGLFDGG